MPTPDFFCYPVLTLGVRTERWAKMQRGKDGAGIHPVILQVRLERDRVFRFDAVEPMPLTRQVVGVHLCVSLPQPKQMVEPLKLSKADCCLHIGHPVVKTRHHVTVRRIKSAVTPRFRLPKLATEHPSFAGRDRLIPVEGITGHVPSHGDHA